MIIETIKNYMSLNDNIDLIIKKSGYKVSYLYEQMGMDSNSFYIKRKKGNFTPDQLMKLFEIIDLEKLEDKILGEMSIEDQKDGIISEEEKRELLSNASWYN